MVTAGVALLLALREGPGYGRELVERIRRDSSGRVRLAEGTVYPALRKLEAGRLVRGWSVVPGRRRGGRQRSYYELTERGVRALESERESLRGLLAGRAPVVPDPEERERMARRVELGSELSEGGLELASLGSGRRAERVA
jgi:DNA-binding PadR family transcriptional regulator